MRVVATGTVEVTLRKEEEGGWVGVGETCACARAHLEHPSGDPPARYALTPVPPKSNMRHLRPHILAYACTCSMMHNT